MSELPQNTPTPEPQKEIGTSLADLTDQNWLFIKHYLQTGNVRKAYKLAGYTGKSESAAYVLFNTLKGRIEEIGSTETLSRTRLMAEVNKLLGIPLDNQKNNVSLSERLRILKFAAAITPEAHAAKPTLSVFIINRHGANGKGGSDTTVRADLNVKDVIDAEEVKEG